MSTYALEKFSDRTLAGCMDAVMPRVPELLTPVSGNSDPLAVRRALVENLPIGIEPEHPKDRYALAKLEVYTHVGAAGLIFEPRMVEGKGASARFRRDILGSLSYDRLGGTVREAFNNTYDELLATTPWLQVSADRFKPLIADYTSQNGGSPDIQPTLRGTLQGGDVSTAAIELRDLASRLTPLTEDILSDRDATELLKAERITLMQSLAYLSITKAGINRGHLSVTDDHGRRALPGLSALEGTLREVTVQVGTPDDGRTYKCPFRHGSGEESGVSPLESTLRATINILPEAGHIWNKAEKLKVAIATSERRKQSYAQMLAQQA